MLIQFFYRLFRSVGWGAISVRFSNYNPNKFVAAGTENIRVRAALAFT